MFSIVKNLIFSDLYVLKFYSQFLKVDSVTLRVIFYYVIYLEFPYVYRIAFATVEDLVVMYRVTQKSTPVWSSLKYTTKEKISEMKTL